MTNSPLVCVFVFTTEPEGKTQKIPLMPPTPAPRKFFPSSVSTTKQDVKVKGVTEPDNQRRFTYFKAFSYLSEIWNTFNIFLNSYFYFFPHIKLNNLFIF